MFYSLNETEQLAARLAGRLACGDIVLLKGEVGAGKTTFARAMIRALCPHVSEVISPTFSLIQPYEVSLATGEQAELWHCDLYRLEHESQLLELGLLEPLDRRLLLVEWPELLPPALTEVALAIHFAMPENAALHHKRALSFTGGARWNVLLKNIEQNAL